MTARTDAIRGWLEVTANLGIVIGLLLVAMQIAQQEEIASDEKVSDSFVLGAEFYRQIAGEEVAASLTRAIHDPAGLTERDHVVLYNLYLAEFTKTLRWSVIEPDAPIGPQQVARWLGLTSNPYGHAWWHATEEGLAPFTPKLREAVNRELARLGPAHADYDRQVMQRIATRMAGGHDERGPEPP